MTAAGSAGLTPAMRLKAKALGVTDEQFNAAAGKLKVNEAVTPVTPVAPTPATPQVAENASPQVQPSANGGTTAVLAPAAAAAQQVKRTPAPPMAPVVSKIDGMPAAQAIAGAKVGAERAWAGLPPKGPAPSNALARAAAPVAANTPTPAPQSSWRGATAPVAPVSGTLAKPKPLDDIIASIDKARAGNRALLNRPTPGAAASGASAKPFTVDDIPKIDQTSSITPPVGIAPIKIAASQPTAQKPGWRGTSPPTSIGQAISNDLKSGYSAGKGLLRKGIDLENEMQTAYENGIGGAVQTAQKGLGNLVAASTTLIPEVGQQLIPGQTGEMVRAMGIPKKVRAGIRSAGEYGSGVVNAPFKKIAGWRRSAFNAASNALSGS
jgi:hypothetical protein